MKKYVIIFVIAVLSMSSIAGELAKDSTIIEVASTSNNQDLFAVKLSDGSGPCTGDWVQFPYSKTQSDASYNQAFSIALAASVSGKKVRVYNYNNDECSGANFISISTN